MAIQEARELYSALHHWIIEHPDSLPRWHAKDIAKHAVSYLEELGFLEGELAAKDAEIERLRRVLTELRDELLAACLEATDGYDSLYGRCMGLVETYEQVADQREGE